MKVVIPSEMSGIEKRTIQEGFLTEDLLMEKAGLSVARGVLALCRFPGSVVAMVGKGNNGADAVVALRHLELKGIKTTALLLYPDEDHSSALRLSIKRLGVAQGGRSDGILRFSPQGSIHKLRHASVVVDGILGTGFRGELARELQEAINLMNSLGAMVLSVDIPSGLDGETGRARTAVHASRTVTFAFPKWGLLVDPGCRYTGDVVVSDIGLFPSLLSPLPLRQVLLPGDVLHHLPERPSSLHKGQAGHVLVWGGSPGKWGAPMLSGLGAQRVGAGLLTILYPDSAPSVSSFPEQMIEYLTSFDPGRISTVLEKIDVVAMGPGLSLGDRELQVSRYILDRFPGPVVADAGIFDMYRTSPMSLVRQNGAPLLLTPHPGEFARYLNLPVSTVLEHATELLLEWSRKLSAIILLKGYRTIIASPEGRMSVNLTGSPNMATAGSGDVLTGVIAGFLSQGMSPYEALVLSAFLHGWGGELLGQSRSVGILARELADSIGLVLSDVASAVEQIDRMDPWGDLLLSTSLSRLGSSITGGLHGQL
ncbi:MAG: NAD(P)H-hydrate dehydratase [Nitrospiraceae bacterium]|jgi:NAD(P)H-hydrate epimerase|nr:NAD(P)H-hydrate dehydratase [Nitrospiraceae bacterium]